MKLGVLTIAAVASISMVLVACGGGKTYDISPIFPLTADKCETYNGEQEGEGINATCMVSQEDCEQAVSDWKESMSSSGVQDAILFKCE